MKRLLTLFAAMIAVVCINAQGQLVSNPVKVQPDRKFERTINEHFGMKPSTTKRPMTISQNAASRMHKAAAETIECPYDEWAIQDYGSDLWFNAIDLQKEHWFYFDPLVSLYSIQMGKEYTLKDMDAEYTYVQDLTTYEKDFITEVTFIPCEYENKPIPGFEAWCTTESGASYHVFYKEPEAPAEFTEVNIGTMTTVGFKNLTATQGVFQFTGDNGFYDFGITISSPGKVEGTYTLKDVYGLNNYTYLNAGIDEIKLCDVEMTITKLTKPNDYHFDAKLYSYDGNVYIFSGDYVEPVVEQTVNITATNLDINDSSFDLYQMYYGYGVATIDASNSDYSITGYLYSYGNLFGHYRDNDRSAQYWTITGPDGSETEIFSADFDLAKVNDTWTIKGSVLGWNNVQYNLDLSGVHVDKDPYDAEGTDIDAAFTLEDIVESELNIEEGYYYLDVESAEHGDAWFCLLYIDENGLTPGIYPINRTFAVGTAQPGECNGNSVYPTLYTTITEDGNIGDMWYCTTGDVIVSFDANENIQMECNAVNTNGAKVHVTVNKPKTPNNIKNVDDTTSDEAYTISGLRLTDAKNLQPGVYVVNGKKHIVK